MWGFFRILLELELARLTGVVYGKEKKEKIIKELKRLIIRCNEKEKEFDDLAGKIESLNAEDKE